MSFRMSCGELFLKSASSTFTGYFLIVSVSFILYGLSSTYYILRTNSTKILEEEFICIPSLCLVFCGLILILLIVLGCCAVCREIPCCLEAYSILLALLATAQITLGVFCLLRFIDNPDLEKKVFNDVNNSYLTYQNDVGPMDRIQISLKCCGVNRPYDWKEYNHTIPLSCCDEGVEDCKISSTALFQEGCHSLVFGYIIGTNFIIGWSLIIVGATEVIAAMMGVGLSCAFWRSSRVLWI